MGPLDKISQYNMELLNQIKFLTLKTVILFVLSGNLHHYAPWYGIVINFNVKIKKQCYIIYFIPKKDSV